MRASGKLRSNPEKEGLFNYGLPAWPLGSKLLQTTFKIFFLELKFSSNNNKKSATVSTQNSPNNTSRDKHKDGVAFPHTQLLEKIIVLFLIELKGHRFLNVSMFWQENYK